MEPRRGSGVCVCVRFCPATLDALRVESVEVVESWLNSISWKVCSVASAAKETRRLASDLRRASRRSCSSRFRAAACCSSSVRRAIFDRVESLRDEFLGDLRLAVSSFSIE